MWWPDVAACRPSPVWARMGHMAERDVLSSLPRSRPQRRSAKRGGSAAEGAGEAAPKPTPRAEAEPKTAAPGEAKAEARRREGAEGEGGVAGQVALEREAEGAHERGVGGRAQATRFDFEA